MLAPWAAELTLITLRDLNISPPGITWKSQGNRISGLPAPGDYLATFVLFAPLAALADTKAKPLAEAIGWAYVLATLLNIVNPSNPISKTSNTQAQQPQSANAATAPSNQGAK